MELSITWNFQLCISKFWVYKIQFQENNMTFWSRHFKLIIWNFEKLTRKFKLVLPVRKLCKGVSCNCWTNSKFQIINLKFWLISWKFWVNDGFLFSAKNKLLPPPPPLLLLPPPLPPPLDPFFFFHIYFLYILNLLYRNLKPSLYSSYFPSKDSLFLKFFFTYWQLCTDFQSNPCSWPFFY